ncbi:MAG: ABC transporter substrate-binding protein, partial [Syntrophorhabdales bacterium]
MRMGFYESKRKVVIGIFTAVTGTLLLLAPSVGRVLAEPVRVGVFPNLHCALIYLADSQGYFKKHGIDVAINAQESGPVAINELIANKIDIAPTAEFAFVLQAFRHPDLRIAATIYEGSDHDLMV